MPEGPEILCYKHYLGKELIGEKIKDIIIHKGR